MSTGTPISFDQPAPAGSPGLDAAIDFVNTTGISRGRPFEDFATAADAIGWLHSTGYLDHDETAAEVRRLAADPRIAADELDRLRAVRDGLRELVDAIAEERAPRDSAIDAVNVALALPERVELVADGPRLRIATRRDGEPFDQALAEIARSVADELATGRPDRFRVCENDTCRWAFYDRSRPGTRRWCEMSSCGNRMKAARHRARQKGSARAAIE